MSNPEELKYTKEHEWVRVEEDDVVVGITSFAADQLGDVVFVELPEIDAEVVEGAPFGVVESVKSVSDLFAPLTGTVTDIHAELPDAPEMVNEDPYGDGWMIRIRVADPSALDELLTAAEYETFISDSD